MGLLIIVYFSDKTRERSGFTILGEIIALIGLVVMITSGNAKVRYAFTHICLSGAFAGGPLVATWIAGNAPLGVCLNCRRAFGSNQLRALAS